MGRRSASLAPTLCRRAVWNSFRRSAEVVVNGMLVATLAFAVLPIVRRRARVRWSHLVRAGIYGLGMLPLMALVAWSFDLSLIIVQSIGDAYRIRWAYAERVPPMEILLVPPLLLLWWWCAGRWYLRLDRPLVVAASVTIIGSLAALALLALVRNYELRYWLSLPGL